MFNENAPVFGAAGSGLSALFSIDFSRDLVHSIPTEGIWQGDRKECKSLYIDNYENDFSIVVNTGAGSLRCPAYSQGYISIPKNGKIVLTAEAGATVDVTLFTEQKTEGFTARGNAPSGVGDPFFSKVASLLGWDGFNSQAAFIDEVSGVQMSGAGGAVIDTSNKKYDVSSAKIPSGGAFTSFSAYNVGSTSGVTYEGWFYIDSLPTVNDNILMGIDVDCIFITTTGQIYAKVIGNIVPLADALVPGNWYHIAFCSIANQGVIYIDGISKANFTYGASGVGTLKVGSALANSGMFYADEIRITKTVRYYAGFDVPTTKFPRA